MKAGYAELFAAQEIRNAVLLKTALIRASQRLERNPNIVKKERKEDR